MIDVHGSPLPKARPVRKRSRQILELLANWRCRRCDTMILSEHHGRCPAARCGGAHCPFCFAALHDPEIECCQHLIASKGVRFGLPSGAAPQFWELSPFVGPPLIRTLPVDSAWRRSGEGGLDELKRLLRAYPVSGEGQLDEFAFYQQLRGLAGIAHVVVKATYQLHRYGGRRRELLLCDRPELMRARFAEILEQFRERLAAVSAGVDSACDSSGGVFPD
jgi:hypothetical protein